MAAPLTVSCAFPPGPDTVAHAQLAESLGYERVWLYDSPVLYGDVWVHLARVAEATQPHRARSRGARARTCATRSRRRARSRPWPGSRRAGSSSRSAPASPRGWRWARSR